jgi:signal transduction histidine kinase
MGDPRVPGGALAKLRHDLSNPLSAILAETQLLLLAPEKYDEETLAGLKQIEDLARKMRQLLHGPSVPPASPE